MADNNNQGSGREFDKERGCGDGQLYGPEFMMNACDGGDVVIPAVGFGAERAASPRSRARRNMR